MRPYCSSFAARRQIICWCLVLIATVRTAGAADPFYRRLVEDGIRVFDRGDYQMAAKDLKIGCFGLLEEPDNLARCLTYLAVAQGEIADVPAFTRTFERILEVEKMFQAFSKRPPDTRLRGALERHLESLVSYEVLSRERIFRHVAGRKREAEIRAMAPEERRAALEQRIGVEPEHVTWRLLMADLDLGAGDFESTLAASEWVLGQQPQQPLALCLRGLAAAGLGSCEAARADLEGCAQPELRSRRMAARLRCFIAERAWPDADLVLSELSPDERQIAPFRQLARELKRERKSAPPPSEEVLEPDPAIEVVPVGQATLASEEASAPAVEPATGEATPADAERQDVSAELARGREVLRHGSRSEIEGVFTLTRQLADRHPGFAELQLLTAEIAYRLSLWDDAVSFFERGGVTTTSRPELQFYLAVALYESGDQASAQDMLERCLPRLEPTDFVRTYAARING